MRIGCVLSVLVLPLLLLVSPGSATSHVARAAAARDASRASGRSTPVTVIDAAAQGSTSVVTPSWVLVAAAAYQALPTPTTTTTSPPTTTTVPVHVVTTTTTVVRSTTTTTTTRPAAPASSGNSETGQASWYQAPAGTCATPNLPFGTVITVTDLATGASVTCTMDDRQSPSTGRVIDLSKATFAELANPSQGVIEVRLTW